MANDVRYRIGVGKLNDNINAAEIEFSAAPFTADSTQIFADSVLRFADEINV